MTDAHGNEVTERTSSIVYTAETPLPDGQRDTFELSFQVPDAEGEVLSFPTIQTCEKGETAWTEVPADGQDEDELESPAPSFTILPASGEGHHGEEAAEAAADEADDADAPAEAAEPTTDDGSSALGWAGLVAGLLGLAAGGLALARTRSTVVTPQARPVRWRRASPRGPGLVGRRCWSRSRSSVLGGASPASAHAELVSTDPEEGAVLETAPPRSP